MTPTALKRIRKALGIDQVALAKRLGVHPITLSRWERGFSRIPKATADLVTVWVTALSDSRKRKH